MTKLKNLTADELIERLENLETAFRWTRDAGQHEVYAAAWKRYSEELNSRPTSEVLG